MSVFHPKKYFENITQISPKWLEKQSIKGILTDLDDTLVPYDVPLPTDELINWFKTLHENGIKILIISNNGESRVQAFCNCLNVKYIHKAGKPKKKAFLKGLELLDLPSENVVFIGDQLFTDIYGANKMQIKSIAVKSLSSRSGLLVDIKRCIEKPIWRSFFKNSQNN